jgi:glucose-1-phosphate thymidylyltransferase
LIKNDAVYLILTDNIFYEDGLTEVLTRASQLQHGGLVLDYKVTEPQNYGVIEFNADDGKAISIEEKPKIPQSK